MAMQQVMVNIACFKVRKEELTTAFSLELIEEGVATVQWKSKRLQHW